MATKPSAPAAAQPPHAESPKKKGSKLNMVTAIVLLGVSAPFTMPTIVLLCLGLIPTLIALITDTDREKSSAVAIGSLNIAGLTPFVIDLWMHGQTMGYVFQILKEPQNLLIILGSAGIGKLIIFAVPPVLASFTVARCEGRIRLLKENLETLKTSWGPDVATTKPLDKIGK